MSERTGGERQYSRRTYLKGLAAVGLTTTLAGCIDLGTHVSSISAYAPEWASGSDFTDADYRRHERNLGSGSDGRISVSGTFVSHAVTYFEDEAAVGDAEPTSAAGTFTSPTGGDLIRGYNPFVGNTIDELLEGDAARLLLDGLGIKVGSGWSWASGPTIESLDTGGVALYGQTPDEYSLVHGVVGTANTSRAVVIVAAQMERERDGDDEIILTGLSMQQLVEEGTGSAQFRSEHGDQLIERFESSIDTVDEIDPDTDLADFE